jgi:hypothetical protein
MPVTSAQVSKSPPTSSTSLPSQPIVSQEGEASATKAPVKEVNLKLEAEGGQSVSLRLTDRQGQVEVSVRSSDPKLAASLRQDLSDLTGNLSKAGLKTDRLLLSDLGSSALGPGRGFAALSASNSQQFRDQQSSPGNDGQQQRRNQPDPANQHNRRQQRPNEDWAAAEEVTD